MTSRRGNERLAILVHELRSPVAALAAVAETAADSSREPDSLPVLVRLAVAACRAIERIVMDVAIASVHLEPVDVSALIRDAVAVHVVRSSDVILAADAGLVVDGDPLRLRQVVDNLIANALAYGESDVTVRASRANDGAVEIAVSDAGPGIPPGELERIFDAGVRLADDKPGSGLGLTLARALVEAHGGSLVARPAASMGATFIIALPAARTHPDTAASSS